MIKLKKITFDGKEYPALALLGYDFAPAEPKVNYIDVPGASGSIDATEIYSESTPYANTTMNIYMAVPWSKLDLWKGKTGSARTQEGLFFADVHGKRCKIRVSDKPGLSLTGRVVVKRYIDSESVKRLDISVDAEPYWVEDEPVTETFEIDVDNKIHSVTKKEYYKSNDEMTWRFGDFPAKSTFVIQGGEPGDIFDIKISGLDPQKTYMFSVFDPGEGSAQHEIYGSSDSMIEGSKIRKASYFILRIKIVKKRLAHAFSHANLVLNNTTKNLVNFDRPADLEYRANRDCTIVINGENYPVRPGVGVVYGVKLPPNKTTEVTVAGNESGTCEIEFRRAVLCTN